MKQRTRVAIGVFPALAGGMTGCAPAGSTAARHGYVRVADGQLYYEVHDPRPAARQAVAASQAVLIHGGMMDHRLWDDQIADLTPFFKVVTYDIRGFGRSSLPTHPYAGEEDLHALVEHLDLQRPHLIGLSLGGRIAVDYALSHPDRVGSLVLVGPGLSGFAWSPEGRERYIQIIEAAQDADFDKAADLWLDHPYMKPAAERPDVRRRIRPILVQNGPSWLMNPLLERDLKPPAAGRLREIAAATLVIVGERDVPDIHRISEQIAAEVPGARKIVISGAGHIVNMEAPQAFMRAVRDALCGPQAGRASP